MSLKQRLFTNMFLRNMLGDFGSRSRYYASKNNIIPYFQYRRGGYQPDHYLYFPKEVNAGRYKNEIFNKLKEYKGYDIIQYLEFHYLRFPDKNDFLRFLLYEASEKVKLRLINSQKLKLQTVIEWISEKQKEQQKLETQELTRQIEQDVRTILNNDPELKQIDSGSVVNFLSDKLTNRIEVLMTDTEQRMETLTNSFLTGNIEVNNHNHQEKLIQLLILISTIQAPKDLAKGEQLFKRFSFTDLASLLHLHFEAFKNKRLNTIQVNIKESNETLNLKNQKVQKLTDAFREFFY